MPRRIRVSFCHGAGTLIAIVIGIAMAAPPANAMVKPGEMITPENAPQVRDLVSPGVYYKVVNGMSMKIVPSQRIDLLTALSRTEPRSTPTR